MPRPTRLALLAVALALAGCSGGGATTAPAREVPVALAGAADMNAGGNAAVVRLYQLTGEAPFVLVPLEEFWTDDEAALGRTLVSKREVLLYPEEVRAVPLTLDARTTHVGVAADFRAPGLDDWRAVLPAGRVLTDGLGVFVGDSALVVTGPVGGPPAPDAPVAPVTPADSTGGR
jgi:type VI secretion system VasD/TssJ family lipoprotein